MGNAKDRLDAYLSGLTVEQVQQKNQKKNNVSTGERIDAYLSKTSQQANTAYRTQQRRQKAYEQRQKEQQEEQRKNQVSSQMQKLNRQTNLQRFDTGESDSEWGAKNALSYRGVDQREIPIKELTQYQIEKAKREAMEKNNTPHERNLGDTILDTANAGAGTFVTGMADTADFLANLIPNAVAGIRGEENPEHSFTGQLFKPITDATQKFSDWAHADTDASAQRAREDVADSKAGQLAVELGIGTVGAIPNAALAMMTAGGSLAGEVGATLAPQAAGLGSTTLNAVQKVASNPSFQLSFAQSLGSGYQDAKAAGASEANATVAAFISAAANALVEVGGGLETLPGDLTANGLSTYDKALKWLTSALDEGKEEVVQGVISALTTKVAANSDASYFSMEDTDAVINPTRMAQEFGMGTAVGGILSGAQMLGSDAYNRAVTRLNTDTQSNAQTDTQTAVDTDTDTAADPLKFAIQETMKPTKEQQAFDQAIEDTANWMLGKEKTATAEAGTENDIPLLLPEQSELSKQRGYPYEKKNAIYKVVDIPPGQNVNQNQQTNFDNDMGAKKSDFEHETKQSKGNTTPDFEDMHNMPEEYRTDTDYIAVTEAESNHNAKLRLDQDYDGEVEELRRKAAWSAEEMSMGRMILEDLWAEADGTDDWTAYQDWAKVFEAHKQEGGRALQNLAQINRRSGLGIVQEAANILDLSSGKDAKNGRVILDQDNLRQIQDVRDTALRLLENIHEALDPGRDHGVPVEDWMQEIGNQLANAVRAKPRRPGTKTTAQTIKSDLLRLAKNFLPKKVKSKTRTNIDTLRDYYDNKAMYDEAWDAARKVYAEQKNGKGAFATASLSGPQTGPVIQQAIVEEIVEQELQNRNINIRTQLGDTSGLSAEISRGIISKIDAAPVAALEIRKNVDRYFDGVRREVEKGVTKKGGSKLEGVNKNIQSDIAKTVKNMGRTAADIIRSGNQSKAETGAAIASALVSQYGISTQNARTAANMIVDRFNQYVAQQSEKALQQRFKPKDKKAKKTFEQDLGELINMGAFTNANWADIVSKKMFGQSVTIDPQLLQEYRNAKNQKSRDAVIEKIKDDVGNKIPWGEAKKLLDEAKKSVDSGKVLGAVSQKAKQYDRVVRHKDVDGLVQLIKDTAAERNTGYRTRKDGTQKQSKYLNWALNRIAGYAKSGQLTGNLDSDLQINASNIQDPDVAFQFLQDFASTGILNIAADTQKVSKGTQVMALRRSGMLSKLATTMRNLTSNSSFNVVDTLARDISVPLDMLFSVFTKTRSTSMDYGYLSKAARQGSLDNIAIASLETSLDVNGRDNSGKYTAGGQRTFKMSGNAVERFLSRLEALQGYEMYVTDEMSKGRTQAEVQRGTDKLYEQGKIKAGDDSLRNAGVQTALYRTFQDETALSNATLKMRDALNEVHAGDVGLGDVMLPFAQVPANLADRAIDYSPAGLAKTTGKLVEALSKAKKGEFTAADQARVVQSLGRNITGTAMIGIAAALAANGLIRVVNPGDEDENKDKAAFEKMQGQNGTQWNLSATMRKLNGGDPTWQDGDELMSIAFLEPMNAQLTIGALLAEDMELEGQLTAKTALKDSFTGSLTAIMDLPMFDTFGDAIDAYTYSTKERTGDKLLDAGNTLAANEVSSLIPNWMKGIRQGLDPYQRDLYSEDDVWGQVADQYQAVFGDRSKLPIKQDSFGRDMMNEGGVKNFLNANILPGYVTKYHTDPLIEEITEIAEATADNSVYPSRKAPDELSIDGEKVPLTYAEQQAYQKAYGNADEAIRTGLMESEAYEKLSYEEKQKAHGYSETYAKQTAASSVNGDYDADSWVEELQGKSEAEIVETVLLKTFESIANGKEYDNKYEGMAELVDEGKLSDAMAITMMPDKMQTAYQNVAKPAGVSVDEWLDLYSYAYPYGKTESGTTNNEKIRDNALDYINKQNWSDDKKTAAASAVFQFLTDTISLQRDIPYSWSLDQGDAGLALVENGMSKTQTENYEKYIQGHFDNDKLKLYLDAYACKGTAKNIYEDDGETVKYSAKDQVIDYIDSLEGLDKHDKIRFFLGLGYSQKNIPSRWY